MPLARSKLAQTKLMQLQLRAKISYFSFPLNPLLILEIDLILAPHLKTTLKFRS